MNSLNKVQKKILIAGIVIILVCCLFPLNQPDAEDRAVVYPFTLGGAGYLSVTGAQAASR